MASLLRAVSATTNSICSRFSAVSRCASAINVPAARSFAALHDTLNELDESDLNSRLQVHDVIAFRTRCTKLDFISISITPESLVVATP